MGKNSVGKIQTKNDDRELFSLTKKDSSKESIPSTITFGNPQEIKYYAQDILEYLQKMDVEVI